MTSTGGFVANAVVAYRESTITFAATARDGYAFSRWEGVYRAPAAPDGQRVVPYPGAGGAVKWYNLDGTGAWQGSTIAVSDTMITMRYNEDDIAQHGVPRLRAVFHETPYYVLNVVIDAEDATTHAPACLGRVHWNPALGRYREDAQVALFAAPYDCTHVQFLHWRKWESSESSLTAEIIANPNYTLVMDKNWTMEAVFRGGCSLEMRVLTWPEDAEGVSTVPPVGAHFYNCGEVVPIQALGNECYVFDHWSGSPEPGAISDFLAPQTTLHLEQSESVRAIFRLVSRSFCKLSWCFR